MLHIYYQNVNGLRTKLDSLKKTASTCIYDVIVLVETNLSADISNSELGLSRYNIYRSDRSPTTSTKSSGGGVLVAVDLSIPTKVLPTLSTCSENVVLSLQCGAQRPLLLGACYVPPQQPYSVYSALLRGVEDVLSRSPGFSSNVILGDFNLPQTDWLSDRPTPSCISSSLLIDVMNSVQLQQINTVANVRGVLLDLIFSSSTYASVFVELDSLLPAEDIHPALSVDLNIRYHFIHEVPVFVKDFRKSDCLMIYQSIYHTLSTVYFTPLDVNEHFDWFMSVLRDAVHENTPLKRIGSSRFPPWFTSELRRLVVRKKILHSRYKATLLNSDYGRFSVARNQCKFLANQCYSNYINHMNSVINSNPKSFWGFVSSLTSTSGSVSSFTYDGRTSQSPTGISNLFAAFFASVYKPSHSTAPIYNFESEFNLSSLRFEVSDVEIKLSKLDPFKGTGPDSIPASVLKHCSSLIAPQLTVLFNKSLQAGVFPKSLKESYVVPIHKSSSREEVTNYRPIVIQSVLSKVFESLLIDKLKFQLQALIVPEQHGFISGRSSLTNLALLHHSVTSALVTRNQVDCIYLDFSKAFDTVSHTHLVAKLKGFGIAGCLLNWFRSYLSDRSLMVKFKESLSDPFVALSGIPQGSHLGPLLFSLFIGDIVDVIDSSCLLFADDLKIYRTVSSWEDCLQLQRCLLHIEEWCSKNCMSLNVKKCVIITFSKSKNPLNYDYRLNNVSLTRKSSVCDLGVLLSNDFTFSEHIEDICCRATRTLGLISRSSRCGLSIVALRMLFISLVRSKLEYCSVIWAPHQQCYIDRLESVQSRFLRLIGCRLGYRYWDSPIQEIRSALGLDTLVTRRAMSDAVFLYKIVNGLINCPALLELIDLHVPLLRSTRSSVLFYRQHCSANYEFYSPLPRLHRLGNRLCTCIDFFNCSPRDVKRMALSLSGL